jgi:hypothetical protein
MLGERYLRSRYVKSKEAGQERERQLWTAWNLLREEALREGRGFTEAPPSGSSKDNK